MLEVFVFVDQGNSVDRKKFPDFLRELRGLLAVGDVLELQCPLVKPGGRAQSALMLKFPCFLLDLAGHSYADPLKARAAVFELGSREDFPHLLKILVSPLELGGHSCADEIQAHPSAEDGLGVCEYNGDLLKLPEHLIEFVGHWPARMPEPNSGQRVDVVRLLDPGTMLLLSPMAPGH